jgi:hypothetical protein
MKTIKVEFVKDHVMFLSGKRTFISSKQLRDKNGEYRPRKKYSIPSDLHDEFVEKGLIKSARKKKK